MLLRWRPCDKPKPPKAKLAKAAPPAILADGSDSAAAKAAQKWIMASGNVADDDAVVQNKGAPRVNASSQEQVEKDEPMRGYMHELAQTARFLSARMEDRMKVESALLEATELLWPHEIRTMLCLE